MKNLLLASSGSVYGSGYLEYLFPELEELYLGVEEILFIPYACPGGITYDQYTNSVQESLSFLGLKIRGIHEYSDVKNAVKTAKGIFVGGGNTFLLVAKLYDYDLWHVLKQAIANGVPYLGTSAGTNITGISMQTTNDMPIVSPESFKTLGVVPFNFNVHYIEPEIKSKHRGESRETRIKEFQSINHTRVLGLKEGSFLRINGESITLKGQQEAYWFENKQKIRIDPNTNLKA
ncbi:MAG: dipeptidase PepE [Wenyingzhuangia sp.]|uniref:dipeptidase PepE n=1 Tax=Wenyingzhuangia sp. TaxID=1964193 RepID=UPI003219A63F